MVRHNTQIESYKRCVHGNKRLYAHILLSISLSCIFINFKSCSTCMTKVWKQISASCQQISWYASRISLFYNRRMRSMTKSPTKIMQLIFSVIYSLASNIYEHIFMTHKSNNRFVQCVDSINKNLIYHLFNLNHDLVANIEWITYINLFERLLWYLDLCCMFCGWSPGP